MAIGAISALLGVLYALAEQDIKRLLAWSTVENVGIILLAVGVAMDGLSLHDPLLTVVGLLGALFHLLNHAVFKGLLFLGAVCIPTTWKKWGHWRNGCRGQPQHA